MKSIKRYLLALFGLGFLISVIWIAIILQGWAKTLYITFLVNQMAVLTTTALLHRGLTHEAVKYSEPAYTILRYLLWITTGLNINQWPAVHRIHHAHTDVVGDPHSPLVYGFWNVQLKNVWYYIQAIRREKSKFAKISRDLFDKADQLDKRLFTHGWLGPIIGIALLCLMLGFWYGLAAAALHTVAYVGIQNSAVNGLGHFPHWGAYQSNPVVIYAKTVWNDWFVGLVTGGEGLHYHHHVEPKCAKLARRWWEIDTGWYLICYLEALGGAYDVNRPTKLIPKQKAVYV